MIDTVTDTSSVIAMRRTTAFMLALVMSGGVVAIGCGHTRQVGDTADKTAEAETKETEKKADKDRPAARKSARAPSTDAAPKNEPVANRRENAAPIATSPAGLLKPNAVEDLQKKLVAKGYLESEAVSGKLDDQTRTALRSFQRDAGLPATGQPDDATVQKLGLGPSDIFRSAQGDKPGKTP